tara:strand:+ start:656 stop:1003 length:348 start_codon:yes stop_codon:yes gene_type:complete
MSVTADLKIKYSSLWSDMTNHAFVNEMGMGTLDPEKFRRYFLQDYVFVNDLVVLTANAISKAPDIKSALFLTISLQVSQIQKMIFLLVHLRNLVRTIMNTVQSVRLPLRGHLVIF